MNEWCRCFSASPRMALLNDRGVLHASSMRTRTICNPKKLFQQPEKRQHPSIFAYSSFDYIVPSIKSFNTFYTSSAPPVTYPHWASIPIMAASSKLFSIDEIRISYKFQPMLVWNSFANLAQHMCFRNGFSQLIFMDVWLIWTVELRHHACDLVFHTRRAVS